MGPYTHNDCCGETRALQVPCVAFMTVGFSVFWFVGITIAAVHHHYIALLLVSTVVLRASALV